MILAGKTSTVQSIQPGIEMSTPSIPLHGKADFLVYTVPKNFIEKS